MSKQDKMVLSLNGDTFASLKDDFDIILARTIGNMTMKGADDAVITLKLSVSLEKGSIGTGDGGIQDITKPAFKHEISSVMQVKDKVSGQFRGEYGMVWDAKEERWVLRKIDNGQMDLFDDDGVYEEVSDDAGYPALPQTDADIAPASQTPFEWLSQFIGEELHISEAMGNYTVRTKSNKVVLSSATSSDSPFYCPAEKLKSHVGHTILCAGYGQDEVVNISIECDDCSVLLYDIDAPQEEDEAPLTDEEFEEAMDRAADVLDADEDGGYDYEDPEE